MRYRGLLVFLAMLFSDSAFAGCDNMPWKFGMSPEEVAAIADCGPYKSFRNGDLETYSGVFAGKKENFQFFFTDGKLRRIGIYFYEGQDAEAGVEAWYRLFGVMSKMFGPLQSPDKTLPLSKENSEASFATNALEIVRRAGKAQIAPLRQPKDANVFSSFVRSEVNGMQFYYVILYLDGHP